jgi:hypothetical protein
VPRRSRGGESASRKERPQGQGDQHNHDWLPGPCHWTQGSQPADYNNKRRIEPDGITIAATIADAGSASRLTPAAATSRPVGTQEPQHLPAVAIRGGNVGRLAQPSASSQVVSKVSAAGLSEPIHDNTTRLLTVLPTLCDVVSKKAPYRPCLPCNGDGMQEVRGSNPLSSTTKPGRGAGADAPR